MTHDEYLEHDAVALSRLVRTGEVTAAELLEIAITRAEALNPEINAIVHWMRERAEAEVAALAPTAPLAGVPFLAKDLIGKHAGHPTTASTRLLVELPAPEDSELVRRWQAAGLVTFGKTNLPEWGIPPHTEPELRGPTRNPWDVHHSTGGSSGGSAAAVAAGIVPVAGGGDGGGSIRIPASCCGLFGLKPTRDRTPTGPEQALLWRGAVVEHVLTRSVRDSALLLDATHGPDPGAWTVPPPPERPWLDEVSRTPGRLRVGWTAHPILESTVHADCVAAVTDAAHLLEELGHEVSEVRLDVDAKAWAVAFMTMAAVELAVDIDEIEESTGRSAGRHNQEAVSWALTLLGRAVPAAQYGAALRRLERTGRTLAPYFQEYDLLLTPTLATPPPRLGEIPPSGREERLLKILGRLGSGRLVRMSGLLEEAADGAFDFIPWTPLFNATGQPAMSVPLHWNTAGLPIGVHLVGRYGDEATLFQVAGQLEEARPWFDRLPDMARRPLG